MGGMPALALGNGWISPFGMLRVADVAIQALKDEVGGIYVDWEMGPWKGDKPPSAELIAFLEDPACYEPLHMFKSLILSFLQELGNFVKECGGRQAVNETATKLEKISARFARVLSSWDKNSCKGEIPCCTVLNC